MTVTRNGDTYRWNMKMAASGAAMALRFAPLWKLGPVKEFAQISAAFLLENKGIRG